MNPQMNYTPQQGMGHDSYSVPCRVGNWAEDEYMGALLTADHMARSEKGMLMTQKLESTLGSALAPAELSVLHPDGNVHFGDQIMLVPNDPKRRAGRIPLPRGQFLCV